MNWNQRFAHRTTLMQRSTVRELLKLTLNPGIISFAGGLPAPDLLPVSEIEAATATLLRQYGAKALQYGETEGIADLRDWIAGQFSRPHFNLRRENVMIVSGSQQALDLVGKVFLDPGDRVLVENPTYLATLLAWRPYGATFETIRSDADGMFVDDLALPTAATAKLLYTVPNFQNPQGTTINLERRRQLIGKSQATGLPIIEDNPYGELRYSGAPLPHLLELDASSNRDDGLHTNVIYLGTFSKVLAPGLRLGWIIAPAEVIDKLVQAKQATDLHTSTLCQHVALELVANGFLEKQLPKICEAYRRRRDAMLAAMQTHFPDEVRWTRPDGGMFLLATLPESIDAAEVLTYALNEGVAFIPGASFHIGEHGRNTMRLNFSNQSESIIESGIARLGAVLKTLCKI